MATTEELSADEIALYDRQLRLWGMEAQNRMRKAKVLLITIKALGNEIAKNLVLAGIGSLTILDDAVLTASDVESQFLVTKENIGQKRAEASAEDIRRLNPRVHVHVYPRGVGMINAEYVKDFDIVIATEMSFSVLLFLNDCTRRHNIPFYAASLHGLYGIVFVDLIEHKFLVNPVANRDGSRPTQPATQGKEVYNRFGESFLAAYGKSLKTRQLRKVSPLLPLCTGLLNWLDQHKRNPTLDHVDKFYTCVKVRCTSLAIPDTLCTEDSIRTFITQLEPTDLSSVAAVLGGILSQDVLNALGGRELPIKNWLFFDARTCEGKVYNLMSETNGKA